MNTRKTLGVYSPYLQGFYFGELISQIQQYCFIKGYNFTVIKTDSFGTFNSAMHANHLDYVIILRNAIHNDLTKYLLDNDKKVVSIGYDYFPLNVPIISCDNEMGVELAFNHLIQNNHRDIAFVGDLSQYDIRKRYEAYCDQHEINGLPLADYNVFPVDDTLFSGGYQAATQYVERSCKATGIICGASLTSIGFAQHIKNLTATDRSADIVGFDAISLIPVTQPNITMIDQNIHLQAYKALSVLEAISRGDEYERNHIVDPKIITANSEFMQADDAFLATSTEIDELHNANYMKSVISNVSEWPQNIVDSNLNNIMTLAPLFERYMQKACYGRIALNKEGREFIKVTKTFSPSTVVKLSPQDKSTITEASLYPAKSAGVFEQELDTSIHLPVYQDNRAWSVLSIYGSSQKKDRLSSFSGFCGYLDNIGSMLSNKMLKQNHAKVASTQAPGPTSNDAITGVIHWHAESNVATWDKGALNAMGLSSDLEQSVYKNMDITDRIHPDDEAQFRECLIHAKETEFTIEIKLKHKNKSFQQFQIERGEVSPDGHIDLLLTLVHSVG